jgi:predicted permease
MNTRDVLLMSLDPRAAGYSNEKAELLFPPLLDRVRELPGVKSAGLTDTAPLSLVTGGAGVSVPGKDATLLADIYGVSPQYFRTMGIELVRGRDFDMNRKGGLPPIVINEAVVNRLFPNENPINRVLNWEGMPHEVIAIASNSKSRTVSEAPQPQIYVSLDREYGYFFGLSGVVLAVRTSGSPVALANAIQTQIHDLEPAMPVYNIEAMADHVDKALLIPRLSSSLFGIFGAVGLALAAVGLYGVISCSVRRRTKEIGIRIAIGARPADVVAMFVRQGLFLVSVGVGAGLMLAYLVSQILARFLVGVSPRDMATFASVPMLLFAVAIAAILIPATRAVSVDALRAIRNE